MGTSIAAIKTLIVPAVISLIIFVVSKYVIVPLWGRYQQRYSQYLPLDSISTRTSSLRQRLQGGFSGFLVTSIWRRNIGRQVVIGADAGSDDGFASEEGEELADVDDVTWNTLEQATRPSPHDAQPRLSRDLEEGFRSDSDDGEDRRR